MKMMKFYTYLSLFFILSNLSFGNDNSPIGNQNIFVLDTTITKICHLTLPDRNDKIIYHLCVENWNMPVKWTISIISDQDTLFNKSSFDNKIDKFFNDPEYVAYCTSGYLKCKKTWYLEKIYNFHIETITVEDFKRRNGFKSASEMAVRRQFFKYSDDIESSLNIWSSFWDYYIDKPIIAFTISFSPVGGSMPLMAYHPQINEFIPIYNP